MAKLKLFVTNHPVSTVLLTILAYFLTGGLFVALATIVSGAPYSDPLVQSFGFLAAIITLLVIAWRFEWLRPMDVAYLGTWQAWLIALALLIYIVLCYWLVFFGEIGINLRYLTNSEEANTLFWRQLVVGFTEEILFRGIIFYALVRVWGGTRRGLYASVILTAFLFAIPHILQGFSGQSLNIALVVIVEAIISGIWYAVYVLLSGSLWPIVLIHAFSNMSVAMKALTEPGWSISISGLIGVILLQLPLVIVGFWLLQRQGPRPVVPDVT